MKYIIDEDVCKRHNLSINDVLGILFCKTSDNVEDSLTHLIEEEYVHRVNKDLLEETLLPTRRWDDEVCAILLESDKAVPKKDRCEELAIQLRALFPKGLKTGNSAWRGNLREITLRLQKFFKLYGNQWSDEEIIDATSRYVEHFNGDYTYMRILKYFIMKSVTKYDEEGNGHIEDISELATWLENDTENIDATNWTSTNI